MFTLSALLFENGLPTLPVLLIEPHRNREGVWRIKFCYETDQPLSMSAVPGISNGNPSSSNRRSAVGWGDRRCGKKRDALRVDVKFRIQ